jgi:GntR family transcriptional regulator of vanillate catabolism
MTESSINIKIREMILSGELAPGARVVEATLSERLNVSRTPIRSALPALAKEGLLHPRGRRGYSVTAYSQSDTAAALEIRCILEGLAARIVVTRGPKVELIDTLKACLIEGDVILKKGCVTHEDEQIYSNMNARFHSAIVDAAEVPLLSNLIERVNLVPFVAPAAVAFDKVGFERAFQILFYAHGQHHAILTALLAGDSARAEFLFREHANPQRLSMWESGSWTHNLRENPICEKSPGRPKRSSGPKPDRIPRPR